jgi:hypothetical protein
MAVTTPDVDERVALAVASLHELVHPDQNVESWLEYVTAEVAAHNQPGTAVELPTGETWLRLVLVVPDPEDHRPHSLTHAVEHNPQP